MMYGIEISEIDIEFIPPQNGLVAFAQCSINQCLRVGNIAIYTAPGNPLRYRTVFPTKKLSSGRQVPCFYPYRKEAEEYVSKAIIRRFIELMDNFQNVEAV